MVRIMTEQNNQEQKETKKTLSKNVRNRIVGLLVIISVILIMVPFLLKDNSDFKNNRSADAIAIVCSFPEDDGEDYANGVGVDPVGGVEAIISHYISKELCVPCAHAPAFENIQISTDIVDSRCSAEYITPTFLPCILIGLSQAPRFALSGGISVDNLDFLVMPYNSLGGVPVFEAQKRGIPIYGIKENMTVLDVTKDKLGVNCILVDSYEQLAEMIQ